MKKLLIDIEQAHIKIKTAMDNGHKPELHEQGILMSYGDYQDLVRVLTSILSWQLTIKRAIKQAEAKAFTECKPNFEKALDRYNGGAEGVEKFFKERGA